MAVESPKWLLSAVLGAVSLLYLYWGLGGKWLTDKASPMSAGQPLIKLSRLVCFCGAWTSFILAAVPVVAMRPWLRQFLLLVITTAFAYRAIGDFHHFGFFKSKKDSVFAIWDTRLYSPLALTISGLSAYLLLNQVLLASR